MVLACLKLVVGIILVIVGLLLLDMRIDMFSWVGHWEMFGYILGGPLMLILGLLLIGGALSLMEQLRHR